MYAIEYHGSTLHRYTSDEKPPRFGWGPTDWQDSPRSLEMLFDLREEAQQCLAKLGAMGAGAQVIQVDRPRNYYRNNTGKLSQ